MTGAMATRPAPEKAGASKKFKCGQCGAFLVYNPGTREQKCPYCGFENPIPKSPEEVEELDYLAALRQAQDGSEMRETAVCHCEVCGAETTLPAHVDAESCPFCGSATLRTAKASRLIKPRALLPFQVKQEEAFSAYGTWLGGLWFAPNQLKRTARLSESLKGVYVPYWTYDCNTTSAYEGQRGDDYWETETYTEMEDGKSVTKTRQVRKTRWHSVRGTVFDDFDDVLVLASKSLPRKKAEALEPWDLQNLLAFDDAYLSGFRAESYQLGLEDGMTGAKEIMAGVIRKTICSDIGGDHQRISSVRTQYRNITFKHILLPVWISAYRFHDKIYRVLVNARTGEVQGERPYSWVKIALLILLILGLIGGVFLYVQNTARNSSHVSTQWPTQRGAEMPPADHLNITLPAGIPPAQAKEIEQKLRDRVKADRARAQGAFPALQ